MFADEEVMITAGESKAREDVSGGVETETMLTGLCAVTFLLKLFKHMAS